MQLLTKTKLSILFSLLYSSSAFAQTQEQTVLFYNVGFGAVTAGIGAVINKPKTTDWKKALVKGIWQGSIGGLLSYSGKKTLYFVNTQNQLLYALPAKILHAAGTSIVANAALGEPFLQNWAFDYTIARIDFSISKPQNFRVRFLPETLLSFAYSLPVSKFNLGQTLAAGTLVFTTNKPFRLASSYPQYGVSTGRAITYVNDAAVWGGSLGQLRSHELVHTFQYNDYMVLNTWFKPLVSKYSPQWAKTVFSKYVYPDAPWFLGIYNFSTLFNTSHYYQNFYEFEAQRFSTNHFVYR